MTPRTVSYLLEAGKIIDSDLLEEIKSKGFSRIPVYESTDENIIGILYVKKLVGFCRDKGPTVGDVCEKRGVIFTDRDTRLDNLLNVFIHNRSHMALVYGEYGMFNGIVTLEDIVEEILKVEIVDEQDRAEDMQKLALSKHKARMEQENMKSETKEKE
jgi:CBS domain containing-hemolysin-like protein